jgi:N-hydroxyarylamine O-acetyltransferase
MHLFNKYLKLINVEATSPTYEFFCKLVKAHLIKVPFENISKLLFKKRGMNYIPDLDTFLVGIEKHNFGGTCYTNNYYFHLLLDHLGFDVKLCGADMKDPDVHLINIVTIDEKEFIVDVGYAAPFLQPLPRDLNSDFVIEFGNERYVVRPKDENGKTLVEQYSGNELQHWYTVKPEARKFEEFREVIEDSFADDSTFMNAIRAVRFTSNGSVSLRNYLLKETNGTNVTPIKILREDIPGVIYEKFGMPEELIKEALDCIKEIKDIYD